MVDATEDWTGGVVLWDMATGQAIRRFTTPIAPDMAVMSPDGVHLLVYALGDASLRLFEVATGELEGVWELQNRMNSSGFFATFSPDNRTFFVGGGDGVGWLWDVQSGEQIRTFTGHTDSISAVAFSEDGKFIATSSEDFSVRIWEVATGREMRRMTFPFVPLSVDFSAGDDFVLVLGVTGKVYLFPTNVRDTMIDICARLQRDFTDVERLRYSITDSTPTCSQFAKGE